MGMVTHKKAHYMLNFKAEKTREVHGLQGDRSPGVFVMTNTPGNAAFSLAFSLVQNLFL